MQQITISHKYVKKKNEEEASILTRETKLMIIVL